MKDNLTKVSVLIESNNLEVKKLNKIIKENDQNSIIFNFKNVSLPTFEKLNMKLLKGFIIYRQMITTNDKIK